MIRSTVPSTKKKLPPGPPNGLIGWGHLQQLKTDLLGHSIHLQREYGDSVSYRIGPMRVYQFSHPDQISELLVKNASSLNKLRSLKWYFKRWMGSGLLLNEGEDWQRQRRKVRSAMQQFDHKTHAGVVVEQTRQLLEPHAGRELDMAACMDRLAFYLNVRILLGPDADAVLEPLYDASNVMHSTGIREMVNWSLIPDWFPTAAKRRLREAMRLFDRVLLDSAAHRHEEGKPESDLLTLMIDAQDRQGKTRGMTDRRARDEAVNLLMGGKETVSASITWSCYLLAQHPHAQQKAADEVRQVLAGKTPELADLERLPYTSMVLQEAMRLYPPVYALTREVAKTVEVGGYRMAKGSMVQVPVYAVHRDERWFARPNEFDPERFQADLSTQRRRYVYMPFGVGPRSCVGAQMGYNQCLLVLATILARYRLRLAPNQGEPALATDIVLHPRDGLNMVLEPITD
jgi:cytochrome P450